jgi:hypothetical protein
MRRIEIGISILLLALLALLIWPACSINVKKDKNGGDDKQVDIQTPIGGIHVSQDADPSDAGLPVYPGAHLKPKDSSGDDKSANVNLSGFGFGLKVVALEYDSTDAPDKIVAFYNDQLKKYGTVLVCHTSGHLDLDVEMHDKPDSNKRVLTCVGEKGDNIELRVGSRENQHIVAIEPEGKGSSFSLVYVRTHGKQADI